MKRGNVALEPWSTKEKLCLSSAVLRSGDQNWMSVSRVLRVFGEQDRPSEWYSQKQCALQYEALLNNVGTSKRKKRSEKGVETVDTPSESIVRKLLQERLEELNRLLEDDRKAYILLKKEKEDIESGRADDRLDEFEREIEEEKEREATRGSILRQHEERNRLEGGRITPLADSQQPETKVPTSPLLTSLLQSPSSYRGGSLHNLLNPSPSHSRVNDSPTLSRLLESPSRQMEPTALFSPPVKKEPVEESAIQAMQLQPVSGVTLPSSEVAVHVNEPFYEEIKQETSDEREDLVTERIQETETEITDLQMEEVVVEIGAEADKTMSLMPPKREPEEQDAEKEEQEQSSLANLQDSDTMEEQQSITELDSQTVNMIVAGAGVISVNHDMSGEHLEEVSSSDIQHKDDSEAAESVKEDSLDGTSDEVNELKEVDSSTTGGEAIDALNNFIIGPETPKDKYVVQVLCSTPENSLEEEAKTADIKESHRNISPGEGSDLGAVLEVGGEMVNLGGAVVVEEEVDTTVHEVEVVVSQVNTTSNTGSGRKGTEENELSHTPESAPHEELQEESEPAIHRLSTKEANESECKDEEEIPSKDTSNVAQTTPKSIESKAASPTPMDEDDVGRRPTKKRLISGSVCSDSKPSSPALHMLEDSKEYRSWKKSIMLVHNRLATHKYASMFLKPITNEQAPAYDTVVHKPVDLFTIKKRVESGELRTTVEFQRDILLMFQNAIMYNNSRSLVYEMASLMQNECLPHIELMVEAMGEGVPWRKDAMNVDKLHTRARGEAPKRKRTSLEDAKQNVPAKRRKDTAS